MNFNRPLEKLLLAGLVTALLVGTYFRLQSQNEPEAPTPVRVEKSPAPKRVSKPIGRPKTKPSLRIASKPQPSQAQGGRASAAQLRGDGVVGFEVKEGLAIAFGDLIIGVPPKGFKGKSGVANLPPSEPWESSHIPYAIDPKLKNPKRVHQAIAYFEENTPIRFIPFEEHPDVLVFTPGQEHCYSYLGRIGGPQPIRLSDRCQWNQIVHEVMHALGFFHEQSRWDRDEFVEILWDNVDPKYTLQFDKLPEDLMRILGGTDFDYRSAMMYSPTSFSTNGSATLRSLTENPVQPTNRGLSELDIRRLYLAYPQ